MCPAISVATVVFISDNPRMNVPAEKMLECFLSGQRRVVIGFEQVGTQWIERWFFGDEPAQQLLLKSITKSDSNWPSSPPWQEVIKEYHDGLSVLMAIGRAGRSHWSGAWKTAANSFIDVEFACRVNDTPEFIGITYQLTSGATCRQIKANSVILGLYGASMRITADSDCSIDVANDGLIRIQPNDDRSESVPRTLQWRFRIA